MRDEEYGAYFVPRKTTVRKSRRGGRKSHRAAGVLISVLLLLTAAICLLVVFLPRFTSTAVSSTHGFGGKTYYYLAIGTAKSRMEALASAKSAADRGGAGYIYNDGEYKIIASVYDREADAKTLVSVNPDSQYFSLAVPSVDCSDADTKALEYLTGEWYSAMNVAATELDRGNITEASAEYAVGAACKTLLGLSDSIENARLNRAFFNALGNIEFEGLNVLSQIRYIQVNVLMSVSAVLINN